MNIFGIKEKDSNELICSNFVNKDSKDIQSRSYIGSNCENDLKNIKDLICIITNNDNYCGKKRINFNYIFLL